MSRQNYEVRVRVKTGPDKWVKKSKFYNARGPSDARSKYKGPGHIMSVQKVVREKLLGIGEFFTLGDALLKEFAAESTQEKLKEQETDKVRKRRDYLSRERKRVIG